MTLTPPESDLLRQMVRQVLHDLVPTTMAGAGSTQVETVQLKDDADLNAFARRIASASADERDAITTGRTSFTLSHPQATPAAAATTGTSEGHDGVVHVEAGAVTERHVREAASRGAVLHLGPRAVLTPLARDRARASGVEITKEK